MLSKKKKSCKHVFVSTNFVLKHLFHCLRLREDNFFIRSDFSNDIYCLFSGFKTNRTIKKRLAIIKMVRNIRKMRLMEELDLFQRSVVILEGFQLDSEIQVVRVKDRKSWDLGDLTKMKVEGRLHTEGHQGPCTYTSGKEPGERGKAIYRPCKGQRDGFAWEEVDNIEGFSQRFHLVYENIISRHSFVFLYHCSWYSHLDFFAF